MDKVPVSTMGLFLEAVAESPSPDPAALADYAGRSLTTAKRALPALEILGLIQLETGSGRYVVTVDGLGRGTPHEEYRQAIRRAIVRFRPFEVIAAGLHVGETEAETLRKSAVILGRNGKDADMLERVIEWALDLDLLERSGDGLKLTKEIEPPDLQGLGILAPEDVESEARARLYLARRLGPDAFGFLDDVISSLLARAIRDIECDPPGALRDSGSAVEDFLREVAADKGLRDKAKKCNGIGPLANMLHQEGVIHANHMHICDGQAATRNTQGHSKDKRTQVPWDTDPQTAFWAVSGAIVSIRSIHAYVYQGRQLL